MQVSQWLPHTWFKWANSYHTPDAVEVEAATYLTQVSQWLPIPDAGEPVAANTWCMWASGCHIPDAGEVVAATYLMQVSQWLAIPDAGEPVAATYLVQVR